MFYIDLVFNLSLLVSLSIISGFIYKYWGRNVRLGQFLQGALFGGVAVVGMLEPLNLGPGLIFDGRSIMVSLCAYFFGPLAAVVASTIVIACRISMGGVGVVTGSTVVMVSACIGLLAHFRYNTYVEFPSALKLYLFGLVVHLAMLATMFTLPEGIGLSVIKRIGLPVLLLYPLATILIGKILSDQIQAKQSFTAIQKSKKRLTDAQRIGKMGDFTWNVETGEVTWSDSLFDLLKYDKSKKIDYNKVNAEIHHPDDLERVTQWLNDCISSGDGVLTPNEYRLIRKDGEVIHVWTTGIIKHLKGKQIEVFATVQDITERKQAEEALRESEEQYRTLFQKMTQGVVYQNAEGEIISANLSAEKILGLSVDQMQGKTSVDLRLKSIHEDGSDFAGETHPSMVALNTGQMVKDVIMGVFNPQTENYRWININATPRFKAGQDRPYQVYTTFEDITERKRDEEDLRKSEEKYRELVESANSIILRMDKDGRIIFFNKFAQDFFMYSEEEIIGKNAMGKIIPETENTGRNLRDMFLDIKRNPQKYLQNENENIKKNGERVQVSWTNKATQDENGNVVEILSIGNDITDKKAIEKQLQQAQRIESIGNLAGGIAHDFNNILSSIIGFTELALDDVAKGTPLEDNLQEVYTAGKRARDLVKQILAFARQSDEERKPIQVDTIAKEALKFIRSTIPTTIEIREDIENNSLIIGNPTQIHQLFMNLCTNAAQAMENTGGILEVGLKDVDLNEKSSLKLSALKPGNYMKITVSDTGPGIAPNIIDSIFEPYFTTKGVGKGTGMGLAMVHGIVETYGGKITVASELGKGTVFSIYLPITKKREDYRPHQKEKLPSGTERILFVDDELPIAKMGSQMLERLGYRVTVRTSSVEALELFRSKPDSFDLVITDMTMPNMTGDNLAMELIALRFDIPVILCTGYSNRITDEEAAKLGIKAFAYKPVTKANLAKTVRKVLDEAKVKTQQ